MMDFNLWWIIGLLFLMNLGVIFALESKINTIRELEYKLRELNNISHNT